MVHPSKRKGDRHELATMATLTALLDGTGLLVERTHDGYERDGGDLHILTPDRVVLFVVQCKDVIVKDWRLPEWLRDLAAQCEVAHAARGFLSVKRPRVLDAGSAYAVCDVATMAALVIELHQLREQCAALPALVCPCCSAVIHARMVDTDASTRPSESIMNGDEPDPDVLPDPPGTVRGGQVYPWRRPARDPVSP